MLTKQIDKNHLIQVLKSMKDAFVFISFSKDTKDITIEDTKTYTKMKAR
jgi:hypothetical protein